MIIVNSLQLFSVFFEKIFICKEYLFHYDFLSGTIKAAQKMKEVIKMSEQKSTPCFTGRNVPISEIAKASGKEPQFIRIGLQKGILKFGFAMRKDNSSEYNYYCPDKLVWEQLGYFRGQGDDENG